MQNRTLSAGARRTAAVIDFPGRERRRARERPSGERSQRPRKWRLDPYRLIIVLALAYFVVTAFNQQLVIMKLQAQQAELRSQIETAKSQQAALRQRLEYLQTDAYIVQEARGRFGLAHPGEIHYRTIGAGAVNDDNDVSTSVESPEPYGAGAGER